MCADATLEGRRLSIYWGGDCAWYDGRVLQCLDDKFKVRFYYCDDDVAWLRLALHPRVSSQT